MKICKKCDRDLPLEMFNKKQSNKDGLQKQCKDCNKSNLKSHYYKNKKYYYDRNKKSRERNREWFIEYKSKLKCSRCDENHPACLDFHHIDDNKEHNISQMIFRVTSHYNRILKEIKKCIVLCSNCHRKEHYNQKNIPASANGRQEVSETFNGGSIPSAGTKCIKCQPLTLDKQSRNVMLP